MSNPIHTDRLYIGDNRQLEGSSKKGLPSFYWHITQNERNNICLLNGRRVQTSMVVHALDVVYGLIPRKDIGLLYGSIVQHVMLRDLTILSQNQRRTR